MFTAKDHELMTRALRLAEQGLYTTKPNPRVGCVIAKAGQIVGEGAHLKAGEPHAEIHALKQAGERAKGATVYVTLEPCSHHGRTPPCAEALFHAGVSRVIAAMEDPNPQVSGSGLAFLQSKGIATASGLLEAQARELNSGFISRMTKNLPYVRSKIAASLDGKTALRNGLSQWITSEAARDDVQHWRARSCVILTGVGTVLADNPSLTVRNLSKHHAPEDLISIDLQPMRVIVDSALKTPADAKVLHGGKVLIAFARDNAHNEAALLAAGAELLCIPDAQGKVCLKTLLAHLAGREINEVMVEGGEGLNGALLEQGLIDELLMYYAPKLMGGGAKGMFATSELSEMHQAYHLNIVDVRQIGADIRVRAKPDLK